MPSTDSTGYHRRTILMEQPTSSGQVVDFSSGCQANFRDGSVINMTTGSVATFAGALRFTVDQTITTTGGTITSHGLTVISQATTDATYTLATPVKGCKKEIVLHCGTSNIVTINPASSDTFFGASTGNNGIIFTNDRPLGNAILLHSTGTAYWRILRVASTASMTYV